MENKFRIGDVVDHTRFYKDGNPSWMVKRKCSGQTCTVVAIYDPERVVLDCDPGAVHVNWLVPADDFLNWVAECRRSVLNLPH